MKYANFLVSMVNIIPAPIEVNIAFFMSRIRNDVDCCILNIKKKNIFFSSIALLFWAIFLVIFTFYGLEKYFLFVCKLWSLRLIVVNVEQFGTNCAFQRMQKKKTKLFYFSKFAFKRINFLCAPWILLCYVYLTVFLREFIFCFLHFYSAFLHVLLTLKANETNCLDFLFFFCFVL